MGEIGRLEKLSGQVDQKHSDARRRPTIFIRLQRAEE